MDLQDTLLLWLRTLEADIRVDRDVPFSEIPSGA